MIVNTEKQQKMETKDIERLKKVNDELIAEGCNNFCIPGISKTILNDVFCLIVKWKMGSILYGKRNRPKANIFNT
jgi:hypothetical protein